MLLRRLVAPPRPEPGLDLHNDEGPDHGVAQVGLHLPEDGGLVQGLVRQLVVVPGEAFDVVQPDAVGAAGHAAEADGGLRVRGTLRRRLRPRVLVPAFRVVGGEEAAAAPEKTDRRGGRPGVPAKRRRPPQGPPPRPTC